MQNTDEQGITRLVLCYSGKFHGLEKNYTIFEKELLSVYLTLNSVHPALVGYTGVIHIYCDNQSIVKVLNKRLDNSHFVNRAYKW